MHWNRAALEGAAQPAGPILAGRSYAIGFDLADESLVTVLRTYVEAGTDFFETGRDAAQVVVSDRPASGAVREARVLQLADVAGRNTLDSLDPSLILSAAALVAAGYSVDRVKPASGRPHLSQRERQVADLLVDGASNKVIARALDISVHTAKFHVTAIMEKLGARNRADAVSILLREGHVPA